MAGQRRPERIVQTKGTAPDIAEDRIRLGLYYRSCHYTYETKDSTLSELQRFSKFTHAEFGEIRQVWMDGQVWFVLNDVAKVLGYSGTNRALRHLRDSQYKTPNRRVSAELGFHRGRLPILITESGLYRLMLRSDAVNAEPFQIWVEDEVLPTVRQAYTVGIDVVEELKGRIRELESTVELHEISAEAEPLRARKEFLSGVEAGRNNPDLDYHAIYEGRFVKWEQGFDD